VLASLKLYGKRLNRYKGFKPVSLTLNLIITLARQTLPVQTEVFILKVFVLDVNRKPQNPVHPAKARLLLTQRKAAVLKHFPFTIILKEVAEGPSEVLRLKIDPGSKTTGVVVINNHTGEIVFAMELEHRGWHIKSLLDSRRTIRRSRRNRKTRYRQPRFW